MSTIPKYLLQTIVHPSTIKLAIHINDKGDFTPDFRCSPRTDIMSVNSDIQMQDSKAEKSVPTLDSLPSELRRIIVSHLAPAQPEVVRPGWKKHLKNANLAHSCLRECIPEFLFRDMSLTHVAIGISSHLERFAVNLANSSLLKHVKAILVEVPPAIRWEIGTDHIFNDIDDITTQRLCKKFNVREPGQLNDAQHQYCANYHRALVKPFVDNRSWYLLLRQAQSSWGQIFQCFPNLEQIAVGCRERVDFPPPTYTNTFIGVHGRSVLLEPEPKFHEDPSVNLAWASAVVLQKAPARVKSLRLSMANLDNFKLFANVNRILSIVYRDVGYLSQSAALNSITRLSITLRGLSGTHGSRDWPGDIASAGAVRYWKKSLNSLKQLRYLELLGDKTSNYLRFSDQEKSDPGDCILAWLLPGSMLNELRTLNFQCWLLKEDLIPDIFSTHWPNLEKIIFDGVRLMMNEQGQGSLTEHLEYLRGQGWLNACRWFANHLPGVRIEVHYPLSNVNDDQDVELDPRYVNKISQLPHVRLNLRSSSCAPDVRGLAIRE